MKNYIKKALGVLFILGIIIFISSCKVSYDKTARISSATSEAVLEVTPPLFGPGTLPPKPEHTHEITSLPTGEENTNIPTATSVPTLDVEDKPGFAETVKPDATQMPTVAPTSKPTVKPEATATPKPTSKPTVAPTSKPTNKPAATPTSKPTVKPTAKPTVSLTAEPTLKPYDDAKAQEWVDYAVKYALNIGLEVDDAEEVANHKMEVWNIEFGKEHVLHWSDGTTTVTVYNTWQDVIRENSSWDNPIAMYSRIDDIIAEDIHSRLTRYKNRYGFNSVSIWYEKFDSIWASADDEYKLYIAYGY